MPAARNTAVVGLMTIEKHASPRAGANGWLQRHRSGAELEVRSGRQSDRSSMGASALSLAQQREVFSKILFWGFSRGTGSFCRLRLGPSADKGRPGETAVVRPRTQAAAPGSPFRSWRGTTFSKRGRRTRPSNAAAPVSGGKALPPCGWASRCKHAHRLGVRKTSWWPARSVPGARESQSTGPEPAQQRVA